jgi:hypothetical protein
MRKRGEPTSEVASLHGSLEVVEAGAISDR